MLFRNDRGYPRPERRQRARGCRQAEYGPQWPRVQRLNQALYTRSGNVNLAPRVELRLVAIEFNQIAQYESGRQPAVP